MTAPKPSLLQRLRGWPDNRLGPQYRADPIFFLRVKVASLWALPGSLVAIIFMAYSASLNDGGWAVFGPFIFGQALIALSAILLFNPQRARLGLILLSAIVTMMLLYCTYLVGGVTALTVPWLAVVPLVVSLFVGHRAGIVTTILCAVSLLGMGVLETRGHQFPLAGTTPLELHLGVVVWAVIVSGAISASIENRLSNAITSYGTEIDRRKKVEQTLRHAQQRLRIAKSAAEAGADAKGSFLAQVSHEIRNPLTAIMGAIDLLGLPADEETQKARVDMLRRSADSLMELVDDVLDFSKIESGRLVLNPTEIDPMSIVDKLERTYRPQVVERGLELLLEVDPQLPELTRMDSLRVRQGLANLLSNALKFTHEGTITIEVWNAELLDGQPAITFGVEDSGIGIPESAHASIFEPYIQAERSITEQYGGTGLGLPICSRLVTLMGGQFGFETELGEGSRFWFTIPADMRTEAGGEVDDNKAKPTGSAHVLVVEDDPLNRQVVGELLESLGHEVTLANGGTQGVSKYQSKQPDLVLMDIQMPDMNGIEASKRIRSWETENGTHRVPILAMTADVEVHQVARYGEAGMNDLLGKPVNRDKLEEAVKGWAVLHNVGPDSPV